LARRDLRAIAWAGLPRPARGGGQGPRREALARNEGQRPFPAAPGGREPRALRATGSLFRRFPPLCGDDRLDDLHRHLQEVPHQVHDARADAGRGKVVIGGPIERQLRVQEPGTKVGERQPLRGGFETAGLHRGRSRERHRRGDGQPTLTREVETAIGRPGVGVLAGCSAGEELQPRRYIFLEYYGSPFSGQADAALEHVQRAAAGGATG
jgi:hypothetical protein